MPVGEPVNQDYMKGWMAREDSIRARLTQTVKNLEAELNGGKLTEHDESRARGAISALNNQLKRLHE